MRDIPVCAHQKTGAVSTKDMTMEEYRQYIHDRISQSPMHPTRMSESISINKRNDIVRFDLVSEAEKILDWELPG